MAHMIENEIAISDASFKYVNRLSDLFFVLARRANDNGKNDVKWVPAATR